MSNKLADICAVKHLEVAARKSRTSLSELDRLANVASPPRGFATALRVACANGFGLIAEIKKASPSKGLIRPDFNPSAHAADYELGGAACISVLTDEQFFQGSDEFLVQARGGCTLPALRKDFVIDSWQIAEARAIGADAILLIAAILDPVLMKELETAAFERGLDVLVEVHDIPDLDKVLQLRTELIGINNRDLRTFETNLLVTEELAALVPQDRLIVSESGIASHTDVLRLAKSGARCFLVGESLMRQPDLVSATRSLLGQS